MPRVKLSDQLSQSHEWLRTLTDDIIAKRSQITEFHGLDQELRELQKTLLDAYQRSVQLRHIRDKGDAREEILKQVLKRHGLIPGRYQIAEHRVRAVAPSGHISPELDIVLMNRDDSVILRRYENTVDYLPIECIHGMIQVKSKLTKAALLDGLENIRAFKSLVPPNLHQSHGSLTFQSGLHRRFAILFAYEESLEWRRVTKTLQEFARENPPEVWPNLIVILNKGLMVLGDEYRFAWKNSDQLKVVDPIVHGNPDLTGTSLLGFYRHLMGLLRDTPAGPPDLDLYWRMPLTAGKLSYSFTYGAPTEVLECPAHGSFLKRLTEANLLKILSVARAAAPIEFWEAINIARGNRSADGGENNQSLRQVRIYNPDDLPLSQLLLGEGGGLTFDSIESEGMTICLPHFYLVHDKLYEQCPQCRSSLKGRKRAQKSISDTPG